MIRNTHCLRHLHDGTLWLPRENPELEAELNRLYEPCGDRKWREPHRASTAYLPAEELQGTLSGRRATIIGKGPSLRTWLGNRGHSADFGGRNSESVPHSPVTDFVRGHERIVAQSRSCPRHVLVAINTAVHQVPDADYCIYVDSHVVFQLDPLPACCRPICSRDVLAMPASKYTPPRIVYDKALLEPKATQTTPDATCLLAAWGIKRIHYVGMDGFDGVPGYAEGVEGQPGNVAQYVKIGKNTLEAIEYWGIEATFEHRGQRMKAEG